MKSFIPETLILVLALMGVVVADAVDPSLHSTRQKAITIYLPDAVQGSQPFCISNRSHINIAIAHGPTLKTGQTVAVSEVRDFAWGFTQPVAATDRSDIDCYVIKD